MSYISYKALLNGAPGKEIFPSRCLRQGDPLSPILFLLCADVLSTSVISLERSRSMVGIRMKCDCLPISHLLFADDCYIEDMMRLKVQG